MATVGAGKYTYELVEDWGQFPQGWILRSSGSMQNAAYPGQHPVPLSLKSPLVLSYRLILHRGEPEPSVLARWHQDFTSPSAASP